MEDLYRIYNSEISEIQSRRVFGSPKRTGDPSLISLSIGEMRRLVDIENSAQLALQAISTISQPDKDLSDAAHALANALASPALHGG